MAKILSYEHKDTSFWSGRLSQWLLMIPVF